MVKTKYIGSIGLAFSEKYDMKQLRKMSNKGWHLKQFGIMGYRLEQGEPEDVIYSIDYRKLQQDEEAEYLELFSFAGWTHICSWNDMHLFKAMPNTTPIYSDKESMLDKLNGSAQPVNQVLIVLCILAILFWFMMTFAPGSFQIVGKWAFLCSLPLVVPAIMTALAIQFHKWRGRHVRE